MTGVNQRKVERLITDIIEARRALDTMHRRERRFMPKTQLDIHQVQIVLEKLGYFDGAVDGDPMNANFRDDLKRFQRDYGLVDDGWYGTNTENKLLPLYHALLAAPSEVQGATRALRRWQLTYYYVGDVAAWTGPIVTMKNPAGSVIARMPAGAFAEAALEGSTKLADGRLAGVAHPPYGPCDPTEFQPVYDIAERNGWIPNKVGYAGIQTADGHATKARNFEIRQSGSKGWPVEHGIECDPFRTLAADIGALYKHDPTWMGKGGVVPLTTRVWILELAGLKLPDGSIHDGWCTVNDTGGGIFGAHFDVFAGTRGLAKQVRIPSRAHVWFAGIEQKISVNYSYGLV